MTKLLDKQLIITLLQLVVCGCFWYLNVIILSNFIPALSSMKTLSIATSKTGGMFLDFSKNYACARIANSNPSMIWDAKTQADTLNKILDARPSDPGIPARTVYCAPYTPQSLFMLMPLTLLPLNQAIIVFESFSILFAILAVSALIRQYNSYSLKSLLVWWVIALAAFPFLQNVCLGQMTFLLVGLLALFFLSWNKNKIILPAICLALVLAIKPQRALIMVIMLLATKQYRLLAALVLFSALLLAASALVIGIGPVLSYPGKLRDIEIGRHELQLHAELGWTTAYYLGVPSLLSFIARKSIGHGLVIWTTILDYILCFFVWKKALSVGKSAYPFAFTISLLIDLMIGPYGNLYDLFFLYVAWAMTLPEIELARFKNLKTNALRFWFMSFSFFPVASWIIETYCLVSGGALHMLLLAALLLIALFNFRTIISSHVNGLKTAPA